MPQGRTLLVAVDDSPTSQNAALFAGAGSLLRWWGLQAPHHLPQACTQRLRTKVHELHMTHISARARTRSLLLPHLLQPTTWPGPATRCTSLPSHHPPAMP